MNRSVLRLVVFFIGFIGISDVTACSCISLDSLKLTELWKSADYVFVGRPVQIISDLPEMVDFLEENGGGPEVRIEVDSMLKGSFESADIVINQFESGNCHQFFELGERYVVFGNRIKHFSDVPFYIEFESYSQRLVGVYEGINYVVGTPKEVIDFWNKLSQEGEVVFTDSCVSFDLTTREGKRIADLLEIILDPKNAQK